MIALEAALFAVTVTAAGAQPETRPEETEPPAELLEFLGDWTQEESKLIDDYRPPGKTAPKPDKRKDVQDTGDEASEKKYGPRS